MSESQSRRVFVKKVAYTAPLVATLAVAPSIASAGSNHTSSQISKDSFGKKQFKFAKVNLKKHHH
jgi:hypothetical protein